MVTETTHQLQHHGMCTLQGFGSVGCEYEVPKKVVPFDKNSFLDCPGRVSVDADQDHGRRGKPTGISTTQSVLGIKIRPET